MGFRDTESGGFYSSSVMYDEDTEQDLIYVSFCGLASIFTGRIEVARSTGKLMQTVMKAQPNFPQKLYTVYSRARGLYISPDIENKIRYVVSKDASSYQDFFQPGAAATFLTSLYQSTGEKQWLELAKEFMRFAEGASDYLFTLLAAGKVGLAASLLYTVTRENKYRKMVMHIGDNIIAAQSKKGYWDLPGTNTPSNGITAEMVVWLDTFHQAIGQE